MSLYSQLKKRIKNKDAVITVIGLGYVGLPMALVFAEKGYKVHGFDLNLGRIKKLNRGVSYLNDVSSKEIKSALKTGRFKATSNDKVMADSDVLIMCVPTPLRHIKDPDISYILAASRTLKKRMRPGQLIVVESTTFPGTTRDVILPELEKSGYELDKDFFLAFSPERIDPGNEKYSFENIPKVLGGLTKKSTDLGKSIYSKVIKRVVGVSSAEVAEVSKLLENTFRIVNIALIYEFAMLCDKLDIDVWEVIEAAKTKPFGYMPFYPGPGIGGHCIPADPMYLSWKARTVGFKTDMVDLAASINRGFPSYVVKRVAKQLKPSGKKLKGANVLIVGVTFKRDVNDLRESPALEIIEKLEKKGAKLSYHDPYIPYLKLHGINMRSKKLTQAMLKKQDVIIITTDHSDLDYAFITKHSKYVFDSRNACGHRKITGDNIETI